MDAKRHEQLESQLSAYLDDELTPEERAEVDAFLADDAEARALLAELQAAVAAVRSLPRVRASDDLMDGLRERLEREALLGADRPADLAPEAIAPFRGRWLAAAAVIALTCAAGYFMWSLTGDEPTGPPTGPRYVRREAEAEKRPASESFTAERDIDAVEVGEKVHEISEGRSADLIATPATPRTPTTLEPIQGDAGDAIESAPALMLADASREMKEVEPAAALGGDVAAKFLPTPAKEPATIDEPAGRAEPTVPLATGDRDRGREVRYGYAEVRSTDAFLIAKGGGVAVPSHLGTSGEDVTVLELAFADAASQRRAVEALRAQLAFRGPDDDWMERRSYGKYLSSLSRLRAKVARPRAALEEEAAASQRTRLAKRVEAVEGDGIAAAPAPGEKGPAARRQVAEAAKAKQERLGRPTAAPADAAEDEHASLFWSSDDAEAVTVLTLDVADQQQLQTIVATLQTDPHTRDFRIVASPQRGAVAQPMLDYKLGKAVEHPRTEKGQPDDLDRQEDLDFGLAEVTEPQASLPATPRSLEAQVARDEKADRADATRRVSRFLRLYLRVRPPATQPTSSTTPAAETKPADHAAGRKPPAIEAPR